MGLARAWTDWEQASKTADSVGAGYGCAAVVCFGKLNGGGAAINRRGMAAWMVRQMQAEVPFLQFRGGEVGGLAARVVQKCPSLVPVWDGPSALSPAHPR